jgi:alkylhydroperoxidase family enzyme
MTGAAADQTLVPLLREEMVAWETLEERYGALLKLVEVLLGVIPNCDRYLEIWPPAFRTYNVMVPNFLNLPAPIFGVGGAPGEIVGLGMYVSSRVAECSYCTAHSCSFALRRGASADKVAQALIGGDADFTRGELATIAVARSLGAVPCELTVAERDELVDVFGPSRAEWIVLGVVMMGFLNKFMNATGVELEQSIYSEVAPTLGPDWSAGSAGAALDRAAPPKPAPPADGLATKVRVLPLLPSALRLDARWQRGVPRAWPQVGTYLREHVGHDFPVLARLRHRRATRAIAFMLRENLSAQSTVLGLDNKIRCGLVFADVVADDALAADLRALAAAHGVDADRPSAAAHSRAALLLARAASPSPAEITADVVGACRASGLPPAAIVELVTWLAVLQMLHRLSCFYGHEARAERMPTRAR